MHPKQKKQSRTGKYEYKKSVNIKMTDELRNRISELSPEPPPATDRNEEKTEFNYAQR